MSNPIPYCTKCAGKHWASECTAYPDDVRQSSLTKVKSVRQHSLTKPKKPWVKPEIRRYVRVESLTGDPFVKLGDVAKFDKKTYQREYMRKKRAEV